MKKLALITFICLASIALIFLVWQLRNVVGILFVAIIIATTMSGFVSILVNRRWSHRMARFTIIAGTLLFFAFWVVLTIYVIGERLPLALADFRAIYADLRTTLLTGNSAQSSIAMRMPHPVRLDDLLLGADGSGLLTIASGISSNFGTMASSTVLVIFVAIYWVADRERIERLWLSLLSPSQRAQARNLIYETEEAIGSHLRSQIAGYVLTLLLLIVGCMALGLKYPLLLAWCAALFWLVPLIGGFLALIPTFLLGLINGYGTALAVILYTPLVFVGVRMFTQRFPSLQQQPGSILGLMITIALIDVIGIVGLALAVPVTAAVHVLVSNYLNFSPTVIEETGQFQMQSMLEKLAVIQNRISEAEATLSPRTKSIFERLNQIVKTIELKDIRE